MRVHEEYRKMGYFWLPGNKELKIPGTLTISDGGDIELEVVGLFDESADKPSEGEDFSRIIGHVEQDGLMTLEHCFYKFKKHSFGGISRSLLVVNKVLSGVAYDKDETVTFNTISFSVEGLDEWLGVNGIFTSCGEKNGSPVISYKQPDVIELGQINGFRLNIRFASTLNRSNFNAQITQRAYVKLSTDTARNLSEFIDTSSKIAYLLCFAVDETIAISDVTATTNEVFSELPDGKKLPVRIKVYYSSNPFSKDTPRIHGHTMLFQYEHIRSNTEGIVKKWFEAYSTISPALRLYFSSVTGAHRYLEPRFLALAQGLETYHRRSSSETLMEIEKYDKIVSKLLSICPESYKKWLKSRLRFGNEISLGQRIRRIIDPYKSYLGNSKQREKLVRDVVDTRNYLAHYSKQLEERAVKGVELYGLILKMEAIFQLNLLQQLGFAESQIKGVLADNRKLKYKLDEN